MSEFANKRYVVTGAASGIGHAVAEKLLATGAEVHSLDRNTPTAAVTSHIEVDLANPRSIEAAVEQLEGRFDGLMNVAGVPGTAPADVVLAVNALAVRELTEVDVRTAPTRRHRDDCVVDGGLWLARAARGDQRTSFNALLRGRGGVVQGQPTAGQRVQLLQGNQHRLHDGDGI